MNPPKFFCDEQLGKLARWLRIIGQDAAFERKINDRDLIEKARAEGRIVLTRDRKLPALDASIEVHVLAENYPAHQLREVVELFRERIEIRVFSRCAVCNHGVEAAGREEVKDLVPDFVYRTQERFTRCPVCGRIYWRATHQGRVEIQLRDILGDLYQR